MAISTICLFTADKCAHDCLIFMLMQKVKNEYRYITTIYVPEVVQTDIPFYLCSLDPHPASCICVPSIIPHTPGRPWSNWNECTISFCLWLSGHCIIWKQNIKWKKTRTVSLQAHFLLIGLITLKWKLVLQNIYTINHWNGFLGMCWWLYVKQNIGTYFLILNSHWKSRVFGRKRL